VDDETYRREVAVLSIGLENARRELNAIKEAMDKLGGVGSAETQVTPKVKTEIFRRMLPRRLEP
jgi:hypothetical protein